MLSVEGVDILSEGEFAQMMRGLVPQESGSGALQAWWLGEELHSTTLFEALNTEARLAARSEQAREIVDRAVERMERAFPGASFLKGKRR